MTKGAAIGGLVVFLIGYIGIRDITWDEFSRGYIVGGLFLTVGIIIGCLIGG